MVVSYWLLSSNLVSNSNGYCTLKRLKRNPTFICPSHHTCVSCGGVASSWTWPYYTSGMRQCCETKLYVLEPFPQPSPILLICDHPPLPLYVLICPAHHTCVSGLMWLPALSILNPIHFLCETMLRNRMWALPPVSNSPPPQPPPRQSGTTWPGGRKVG